MARRPPQYERYSWYSGRKPRKVSARLPERLVKALNVAARKYHRTREQIIRIGLEDWLREREDYQK